MLDRRGRTDVLRGVLEKELVSRKLDLGEPGCWLLARGQQEAWAKERQ